MTQYRVTAEELMRLHIRVVGPPQPTFHRVYMPLHGMAALQEKVMTLFIDLAAKAGVGMKELGVYFSQNNLGPLAWKAMVGGAMYAAERWHTRTKAQPPHGGLENTLTVEPVTSKGYRL